MTEEEDQIPREAMEVRRAAIMLFAVAMVATILALWLLQSVTTLTATLKQRYDCPAPASAKPRIDMEPDHGRLDHKAARQDASV